MTKSLHPTEWQYRHVTKAGELLWASGVGDNLGIEIGSPEWNALLDDQPFSPNALADEGENAMLDVFFRAGTAPTNFYLALFNDTPVDTDTMATLTGEASGSGYARQLIERSATGWPTLALDAGDFRAVSSTETFTATGGTIGPVTYAVLTTTVSGTAGLHIVYNALSASRTLNDGDSLQVTMRVKAA